MRVVIPAFRASDTLPQCISALQCSGLPLEITVVDDGENGDLKQILAAFPVQIVTGRDHSGAAAARNRGAAGYTGDILVFVDADVVVEADTIQNLVAPIQQGISEATVGNYSCNTAGLNFFQAYKELYISHIYSRRSGYIPNEFWTAIGAVRADIFFELGGFKLGLGVVEDTELGHRINERGGCILVVPNACGQHLKPYTFKRLVQNDLCKGISISTLYFSIGERVSSYRHASRRDMLAVAIAGACLALSFLTWFLLPWLAAISFIPVWLLYGIARWDLINVYRGPGAAFLIKSLLMMFLLDLVRGVALLIGLGKALSTPLRSPHSGSRQV